MPKFAATLASLLLIASSIGINIARYPQVGRTIDAGQRIDMAQAENSALNAQPSSRLETANPDSLLASKTDIQPENSPQIATAAPAEIARVKEPDYLKPPAVTGQSQPEPLLPILNVRPMVPATTLQETGASANPPVGPDEVRRLPPVDPGLSAVADLQATASDEVVQYPASSTP